jgi:hypothetical protein
MVKRLIDQMDMWGIGYVSNKKKWLYFLLWFTVHKIIFRLSLFFKGNF